MASTADSDQGALLLQARSALIGAAATIDRLSTAAGPSIELIEATRAVQNALIALRGWGSPPDDAAPSERVLTSP